MNPNLWIGLLCFVTAAITFFAELVWALRKAYKRGYDQGWKDGAEWWLDTLKGVDEQQELIRREEPKGNQWP
jgi:hypothetical protein